MNRDIFQAVADPSRRAILALLAISAMTPNAIAGHFDSTRQTISKHIQVLTGCGAVTWQKKGREIYYRLNHESVKELDTWLQQFRKLWDGRFDQLDDVLKNL